MSKQGLTDHELLIEVREDIKWIKEHLGATVTRKEVYGVLAGLATVILGVWAVI